MEDFFESEPVQSGPSCGPDARQNLAYRMRPRRLDDVVGQTHLLAPDKLLYRLISADRIQAILLFGPPGTGKTSLAHVIAQATASQFVALNAVEASVSDLRKTVATADELWKAAKRSTLLLIDEIHRFNRSQQDAILPHVESGIIKLVGATTQNPYFSVNSALLSRMQLFELHPLKPEELRTLCAHALDDAERGLGGHSVQLEEDALEFLVRQAEGDARRALNALEIAVLSSVGESGEEIHLTLPVIEEVLQKRQLNYDRTGDEHFDALSAFIKCIRGSEPDAAIYLLALMLEAGEEPRAVARRLVISAAEDVGLADPRALSVAVAAQQAVECTGMPEARIPLAEATVYLAAAPKSNRSYAALDQALEDIRQGRRLAIPASLKDSHYPGAAQLGRGTGYQYAHDFEQGIAPRQFDCPAYYHPTVHGFESRIRDRLEKIEKMRKDL